VLSTSIFPTIFIPLYSLLVCGLIPVLAFKGRTETSSQRWFTILCVLGFVYNLFLVSVIVFPPSKPLLAMVGVIPPIAIFFLPLGLGLAHQIAGLEQRHWLINSLFIIASIITITMWLSQPPGLIWLILALCLSVLLYAAALLVRGYKADGATSLWLHSGVIILSVLSIGAYIPVPGLFFTSPLSLVFIPMSLMAVGFSPQGGASIRRRMKKGAFYSLALAFIILPLSTEIIILLYSLDTINLAPFWSWLTPHGITNFFSIFICVAMANFCLRRTYTQPGSMLFAIICLLWCMNNIQNILLVIFPEELAVQTAVLNDAYLVTLAGFLTHMLCVLAGRPRSRLIPISYAIGFTLMPLIIFQTNTNYVIYQYPSGPFIKAEGIVYDLFALHLLTVLSVGSFVFFRLWIKAAEPEKRRDHLFAAIGLATAALLMLGTVPIMIGHPSYPFHNLIFVALSIVGYGVFFKNIISSHARRTIITRLIRATLIFIYAFIALLITWILKEHPLSVIALRMVPYGLPPLISMACAVFLSLFVLGMEHNRIETYLFSVLCLVLSGMSLDVVLLVVLNDPTTVLTISRIDHFFVVLCLSGLFLHFTWLTARIQRHWWVVYLGYVIGIVMAPLTLGDLYFSGLYIYEWGFFPKAGVVLDLMSLFWFSGLFFIAVVLLRSYRAISDPNERISRRYIWLGFGTIILLCLSNIPCTHGHGYYPLSTLVFVPLIFLAYGLFKYNLFLALQNVRSIITMLAQVTAITMIALLPRIFVPSSEENLAFYLGILLIFFLYKPVHDGVNHVMNLFIRSASEDLKQSYYDLTQRLSQVYHLKKIDSLVTDWFFTVLMTSRSITLIHKRDQDQFDGILRWNPSGFSGIFSSGKPSEEDRPITISDSHPLFQICKQGSSLITHDVIEQWLHAQGAAFDEWITQAELMIPIHVQDRLTALIVTGGKITGLPFTREEFEILRNLSLVLGPNIENARLLEGLENEVERRTEDLNLALIDSLIKEKEITESNTIITRQNEIFRSLLETSTQIHQIWKLDALFSYTLEQVHTLFPDLGFGIILEGDRSDVIESIAFVGIDEKERDIILANREMLLDDDIDGILRSDLLVKGVLKDMRSLEETPHWTVLPMMLSTQRVLGKMIIKGNLDQTSREVISVFLGQLSAVTQSKLLMRELEKMASMDGLTGVYNRSFFDQEHVQAIANANRYHIPFAIIMIDVNELKAVNDYYGHERGDEMIVRVAHLLKEVCRKTDIAARIGGDEFAALMPSTTLSQAENVVQRLRNFEEHLTMLCKHKDGRELLVPIRISIGVCASDEMPPDEVFKEADRRMYMDKELYYTGRERYR